MSTTTKLSEHAYRMSTDGGGPISAKLRTSMPHGSVSALPTRPLNPEAVATFNLHGFNSLPGGEQTRTHADGVLPWLYSVEKYESILRRAGLPRDFVFSDPGSSDKRLSQHSHGR